MSSTNRSNRVTNPDDWYRTPSWCVRAILPFVLSPNSGIAVLDPACGDGAILDAVREYAPGARTFGIEIDDGRAATAAQKHEVRHADALANDWTPAPLAVLNPPFSLAMEFVEASIVRVERCAVLLRLAFLASQKRAAFHRTHPSDVYVLPKRPSFTPDGKTDSADYAWFVFGPNRGGLWSVL
jgi:hypothetical protein